MLSYALRYAVETSSAEGYLVSRRVDHVHLASFDCEGWDALVLEGLGSFLRDGRVDVLEFEYSSQSWGSISRRRLAPTIEWLSRRLTYTCFWQGNHGCLAPVILEPCALGTGATSYGDAGADGGGIWAPDGHEPANVVCARQGRADIIAALWTIADECYHKATASMNASAVPVGVMAIGSGCGV